MVVLLANHVQTHLPETRTSFIYNSWPSFTHDLHIFVVHNVRTRSLRAMTEGLELRQLVSDNEVEDETIVPSPDQSTHKRYPYIGILLATLSSLFFSLCSVIVKWMVHVDPMELAVCRFVGVLLPVIPILIWKNEPVFPPGKRVMLFLRSFVGTTGLMLSFYSFRHMPLADASVIVFSVPVFVAIFAYVFLREPCGLFNVVTIILTLLGVILITRPTFLFGNTLPAFASEDEKFNNGWGAAAAFGATLFGANAYVLLRALKSLHFAVVMANFGTFALVQTVTISWYLGELCWPQCGLERLLMIALAIFSFIG